MQLTRRDALVALGALGIGSYGAGRIRGGDADDHRVETIRAVAEVVYPSQVAVDREFVETWVDGRIHADEAYERESRAAIAALDETARREFGSAFAALSPGRRTAVFRRLGVDRVHSDRDGTTASRVRYYLVNELLYALYRTPVGGRLFGIENPPGYPGGRAAYREGPDG
ncbi:MAG: gluconate 2-dehydrogenase subunit 3 family protein [Haloarculaceae archaeon]